MKSLNPIMNYFNSDVCREFEDMWFCCTCNVCQELLWCVHVDMQMLCFCFGDNAEFHYNDLEIIYMWLLSINTKKKGSQQSANGKNIHYIKRKVPAFECACALVVCLVASWFYCPIGKWLNPFHSDSQNSGFMSE